MYLNGRILWFLLIDRVGFLNTCNIHQRSSLISRAPLLLSMKQRPSEKRRNQYDVQNRHNKVDTFYLQSSRVKPNWPMVAKWKTIESHLEEQYLFSDTKY